MSRKRHPLRVAHGAYGIRAQELRTLAKTAWWARRWIESLETMRLGARFGRGRQYAVSGQVTEFATEGSRVEATVVGSRPDPYRVTLEFTRLSGVSADKVSAALRDEPMMLGRILTGDLPIEVESMFHEEGLSLFPRAEPIGKTLEGKPIYDVRMSCGCPDWTRPCKHLVAVMLLLGEEVARHPATLLALRGIDMDALAPSRAAAGADVRGEDVSGANAVFSDGGFASLPGRRQSMILKRLGPVPFWRGGVRFVDAISKMQGRIQPIAEAAAEGKSIDLRS